VKPYLLQCLNTYSYPNAIYNLSLLATDNHQSHKDFTKTTKKGMVSEDLQVADF